MVGGDLKKVIRKQFLFSKAIFIMSYRHKGFDNEGFELDVPDSHYNDKGKHYKEGYS